jgi:hypothetical protein
MDHRLVPIGRRSKWLLLFVWAIDATQVGCGSESAGSARTSGVSARAVEEQPLGEYQSLKLLDPREGRQGSLKGVTAVDARVWVGYDARILVDGGMEQSQISHRMESRFFLELRKLGIRVDAQAPNVASCNLALNYSSGHLAFSKGIRFDEFVVVPRLKRTRKVTVFESPYLGQIAFGLLGDLADNTGQTCAEDFGTQWLADNR